MGEKNSNNTANCGRDHLAIDFNALTYSSDTLLSGKFFMSPKCCIFKIPNILSRHNEKAYAPDAFSIGPWHLGKPHLESAQKIKRQYLQGLLRRSSNRGQQLSLLEEAIRTVENGARDCYAGPVEIDARDCNARPVVPSVQDFVQILVLDGCFIIELFRKAAGVVYIDKDDPIFAMSCMYQFLFHDLILLENQIPWFVLELLFDMTETPVESKPLDQLAIEFLSSMFSVENPSMELFETEKFRCHKSKHILDLLRNWLILSQEEKKPNRRIKRNCCVSMIKIMAKQLTISREKKPRTGWQSLPSATALREAGIKFKRVKSNSILDVNFRKGVLEIPPLLVQETTETVFRNLISLEQCTPHCSARITSYAVLIDNLIDTTKDMELLCKEKIIDNWLNMDDSTQFFNKLYNDTYVKEFDYYRLFTQVNDYCDRCWPRWRANLTHKYFNTPWAVVGVVVAGLILVLTIGGTVCSIIQVV